MLRNLHARGKFLSGPGEWTVTTTFVNSTCPGHSPGNGHGEREDSHGYGLVTYTPAGTAGTVGGVANVNTPFSLVPAVPW